MASRQEPLRRRIESGERSFEAEDLDEQWHDLQELNLEGVNFSRVIILGSFRGSNLKGAVFTDANVKTCDFSGADLRNARFTGAAIDGADFSAARLEGADFEGASDQGQVFGPGDLPFLS